MDTRSIFIELIDPSCYRNEVYQLYWLNRRGGVDWIVLNGKSYNTKKVEKNTYQVNQRTYINDEFIGDLLTDTNPQYLSESYIEYNLNSDLLGSEYKYLADIFSSSKLWLYSAQDESIRMVDVIDTNFLYKTNRNQNGTYNFTIILKDKIKNIFI